MVLPRMPAPPLPQWRRFFIFFGLGSLLILRLDVSLGGPSDGGSGGSIVVSVVLVELEG